MMTYIGLTAMFCAVASIRWGVYLFINLINDDY